MTTTTTITGRPMPTDEERRRLFRHYVEPHIDTIRRYVEMTTTAGEDPDDNMQDVLLNLYEAIACYDPAASAPATWISRVVHNRMVSIHRATATRLSHVTAMPLATDGDDPDDRPLLAEERMRHRAAHPDTPPLPITPGSSVPALPLTEEDGAGIPSLCPSPSDYPTTYAALQRLTALQRRALLLASEGWTASDVAREFRITCAAASSLLYRARQRMAEALTAPLHLPPTGSFRPRCYGQGAEAPSSAPAALATKKNRPSAS